MKTKVLTTTAALGCAAALAVPAGAGAAGFDTAVREVQSHTSRADAALDRARRLLNADRDREANREYARSRRELALARRDAARLSRSARTGSQRAAAARAQALVADQQGENVEQLSEMLDEARGRVENQIAQAALSDTRGRDKAIAVISALIDRGVSSNALPGLTRALSALAQDRDDEVQQQAEAIVEDDVSSRNDRTVARAIESNVDGQATAAQKLAELIASEDMPEAARQGLQRAFDAVTGEQERSAQTLIAFSDRMPARIRSFVEQVVQQARENAQGMRENRPAPPTGGPGGAPTGQPDGTPGGQPEGTPGGPPAGTPGPGGR